MGTNPDFVLGSVVSASVKFLVNPAVDDYNSLALNPEEITAVSYFTVETGDTSYSTIVLVTSATP